MQPATMLGPREKEEQCVHVCSAMQCVGTCTELCLFEVARRLNYFWDERKGGGGGGGY